PPTRGDHRLALSRRRGAGLQRDGGELASRHTGSSATPANPHKDASRTTLFPGAKMFDKVNYLAWSTVMLDRPSRHTAAVRQFNRFYTRAIGILDDTYLTPDFSLTAGRVLYELAHRHGVTATELRQELRLDAGYLSRILKDFETRGFL